MPSGAQHYVAALAVAAFAFWWPAEKCGLLTRIVASLSSLFVAMALVELLKAYRRAQATPKANPFDVHTRRIDLPTAPPGGVRAAARDMCTLLQGFPITVHSRVSTTETGFQVITGSEKLRAKVAAGEAGSECGSIEWVARRDEWIEAVRTAPSVHDASASGAATGTEVAKTNGIPNYMLRFSGKVARLGGGGHSEVVADSGVLLERDRVVVLVTSDVIEMVQQQGGAAASVDRLGEDVLVEGMLFDDFKPDDTLTMGPFEADEGGAQAVTLEIIEPRQSTALELEQLGGDDSMRQKVVGVLSLAAGFAGWRARVVVDGRVRPGFRIAKLSSGAPPELA